MACGRKSGWATNTAALLRAQRAGVQASVYNVTTKSWLAPSEPVEDIEQARKSGGARASVLEACRTFGTAAGHVEGVPLAVALLATRVVSHLLNPSGNEIKEWKEDSGFALC